MKNYFENDYKGRDDRDIKVFLKRKYDEADEIFDRRFSEEVNNFSGKIAELQGKIQAVKDRIEAENYQYDGLASLTLGNLYLRLAQCRDEKFLSTNGYYRVAVSYFGERITLDNVDDVYSEIDLLLMLNKGKYFRNTAQIGKKSVFEKALDIFSDVTVKALNSSIVLEKKVHIYLDALINIGRVKRYSYSFDEAINIFLAIVLFLEKYIDQKQVESIRKCSCLNHLLTESSKIMEMSELENIVENKLDMKPYMEYLIQALIHIGIIFRKEKRYAEAIEIFNLVNKVDNNQGENNIDAQNNLGVCYRKISGEHEKAEEIFEKLSSRGNKFACVNLYKCYLMRNDVKYEKCFEDLKKKCELSNSIQLEFILGLFYLKEKDYKNAAKLFENVYESHPYISRGSIGFKALYNLSQCMICEKKYTQSRKILGRIRELLQKQAECKDPMVEIDYGWCLMQERNYKLAVKIYSELKDEDLNSIGTRNWMRIHNNLAECYIHINKKNEAKAILKEVVRLEPNNRWAKYLMASIDLSFIIENENKTIDIKNYQNLYKAFTVLAETKPAQDLENAGWLISAILLINKYQELNDKRSNEIINTLIEKLRYSTEKITMKSYFYLAEFVLERIKRSDLEEATADALYRCFSHMELVDEGENVSFSNLMESPNFHYFGRKHRAEILANIVLMYKHILNIKSYCCYSYSKKERDKEFPVHYTKLNTLKILLSNSDGTKNKRVTPKLRLWNTAYMNDSYEGGVFGKLLCHAAENCSKSKGESNATTDDVKKLLQIYFGNIMEVGTQIDSEVYITSFSKALNSFQMWNIYADDEKGCAIRFDDDFFDIKDDYHDPIEDAGRNVYSLYEVQYYDVQEEKIKDSKHNFDIDLVRIWENLRKIEEIIGTLEKSVDKQNEIKFALFKNAIFEVRSFVADRLNEIRFLFKTQSYEYEKELRLIRCSRSPKIDEDNFKIPRLYIDVERDIDNLEVTLGRKLEKQKVKDFNVWLRCTGKVKRINGGDY
ncbi:DUF2971 domain-containing protein [Lachnospiraceae bacterium DSM 108991]|uniref:DUF2971 domain-containing protein n=1 Tax=Claveliimonas monacensis TaxID=2779351 RepID=A0ABR9RK97_9FIRM|nr:tetratricopeptide repeat protein [Claveliimonas monacensis]MBE5063000.1 DUF2971 domain-containing protein [Claveliimonas monacensis]